MKSRDHHKTVQGFSLIELMIVVVIVAVLLAVAGPSFFDSMTRNSVRTQASRIVSSLNLARSTAVKRNHSVTMCASADSTTASVPTCSGTWMDGWVVFLNADENQTPDAGEVVRGEDGTPPGYFIKNAIATVSYFPDGTASTNTASPIYLCPPDKDHYKAWRIELEATGRPQMSSADPNQPGVCL